MQHGNKLEIIRLAIALEQPAVKKWYALQPDQYEVALPRFVGEMTHTVVIPLDCIAAMAHQIEARYAVRGDTCYISLAEAKPIPS